MSADDALAVQERKDGKVAVQWFQGDNIPNPEEAREKEIFEDMSDALLLKMDDARATEYGFWFPVQGDITPTTEQVLTQYFKLPL